MIHFVLNNQLWSISKKSMAAKNIIGQGHTHTNKAGILMKHILMKQHLLGVQYYTSNNTKHR